MSEVAQAPKRRNWLVRIVKSRDFTRDIIVTTLGVLIALGIGAIVDAIGWRMRLAATERMMDRELAMFRGAMAFHTLSLSCAREKVAALEEILETSRASGLLPTIDGIGFTADVGAFGDSWQLAQGSDVMLHMGPERAMEHAGRWVNIRFVSEKFAAAQPAWQQMAVLQLRPGPINIETIDDLSRDLTTAAYSYEMAVAIGGREDERLGEEGIARLRTDGEPFDLAQIKKRTVSMPICQPLLVDGKPYRVRKEVTPVDLPKDLVG